jgi:hypothetical protein
VTMTIAVTAHGAAKAGAATKEAAESSPPA